MAQSHVHHYRATVTWSGAAQGPTANYRSYSREYTVTIPGRITFQGSADPTFRGDPALPNPEDLLMAAVSSWHMLSYLAECSVNNVRVVAYEDEAEGTMDMKDGQIRFVEAVLRPRVTVDATSDPDLARRLHERAQEGCFVANSVNFPIRHEITVVQAKG